MTQKKIRVRNIEIVNLWVQGKGLKELAERFNINRARVDQIVRQHRRYPLLKESRARLLKDHSDIRNTQDCEYCGNPFIGVQTKYCSSVCRKLGRRKKIQSASQIDQKYEIAKELRLLGDTWQEIAHTLGYHSQFSCISSIRKYAKLNGKEWPLAKRK